MSLIENSFPLPGRATPLLHELNIDRTIRCPNFNSRHEKDKIRCICLHHSGSSNAAGDLNYLSQSHNPDGSRIYAGYHYYINDRGMVYQLIDDRKRAWHAGQSIVHGQVDRGGKSINGISLGICLTGDGKRAFSESQYASLIQLVYAKSVIYQVLPTFIVGHFHVSPGRKIDPQPLDWNRLFRGLYSQ